MGIDFLYQKCIACCKITRLGSSVSNFNKGSHQKKTTKLWTLSKKGGVSGAAKPFIEFRYGHNDWCVGGGGVRGPCPK